MTKGPWARGTQRELGGDLFQKVLIDGTEFCVKLVPRQIRENGHRPSLRSCSVLNEEARIAIYIMGRRDYVGGSPKTEGGNQPHKCPERSDMNELRKLETGSLELAVNMEFEA
jgi:hypothetical protein